jgi:tRNA/rRNA methyltransferase
LTNVTVVLVRSRNSLNIGAAARAMSNFGFDDLRLVEAYRVAADEARSGVKAGDVLANARDFASVADAVADCHLVIGTTALGPREIEMPCKSLIDAAKQARQAKGRVAILFGSEKFGLSNDDMSHCHLATRIPTRLEHRAMNLGQAVAVTLYELIRTGAKPLPEKPAPKAAADSNERIGQLLIEALTISGYARQAGGVSQERKIRQLIRRMDLSEKDAMALQGMLRQLLWKLRR